MEILIFVTVAELVLLFLFRCWLVDNERRRIMDEIKRLGLEDIHAGYLPFQRLEIFNEISFAQMVWHFWRPVKSFYRYSNAVAPTGRSPDADERAAALLDSHLTADERNMLAVGYLRVKGRSGKYYCIHATAYGIVLFEVRGRRFEHSASVCCRVGNLRHLYPVADQVLALKLCLQSTDEERLVDAAVKEYTEPVVHGI